MVTAGVSGLSGLSGLVPNISSELPGWWNDDGAISNKVYGAWAAVGASDYEASLVDLSGYERDLTEGVAPTWDAVNGWTGNGSSMYLRMPFPCTPTMLVLVRFSNCAANMAVAGVASWPNGILLAPDYYGGFYGSFGDQSFYDAGNQQTTGLIAVSATGIWNGLSKSSWSGATGMLEHNIALLAAPDGNDTPAMLNSGRVLLAACFDPAPSDAEMQTIIAAAQAV